MTGRPKLETAPAAPSPRQVTRVVGSWSPPTMLGEQVDLSVPRVSSGAQVRVIVACAPASGCTFNGETLTVSPLTKAEVTWTAPATTTHRAWTRSVLLT